MGAPAGHQGYPTFWRYSLGLSVEHREQHVGFAGTVLPIDHVCWATHDLPTGRGCKCYMRAPTRTQVKVAGGRSKPRKSANAVARTDAPTRTRDGTRPRRPVPNVFVAALCGE